jgi:predicted RNase H-like HicB family nuclease
MGEKNCAPREVTGTSSIPTGQIQEGRTKMSEKRYAIVIERTTTGFSAYSPDVPGCAAAGDTEKETRQNFRDALADHFETMREIGDPIPEPSSSVDYVEVGA